MLFDALLSSLNGATHCPYHSFVQKFSLRKCIATSAMETGEADELVVKILECKNVRSLGEITFLADLPQCNLTAFRNLSVEVESDLTDENCFSQNDENDRANAFGIVGSHNGSSPLCGTSQSSQDYNVH